MEFGLLVEPILREPFVVVLSDNHPLATSTEVTLQDLAQDSFILVPPSSEPGYYERCISLFERANFTPTVSQEASHKLTILSLVAAGIGVSLATVSIRNIAWQGVVYLPLKPSILEVELAVLRQPDYSSPVLQVFLEVIRENFN
ncbi:MAG: LysR family substrate-binding domain-containing protein [Xenococcaceae cyanobacterium]